MILGLDLGQHIGWVRGAATGPLERGTFTLKNTTDLGLWLSSSDGFFGEIMPGVSGIAVEQPFLGSDYFPARKLISLLGHVYYHARSRGIGANVIKEVPVATGKRTLSGRGNAEAWQMIEAAAKAGYDDMDEHQAHALGIWWVYVFGKAEDPPKPPRASKGRSLKADGLLP